MRRLLVMLIFLPITKNVFAEQSSGVKLLNNDQNGFNLESSQEKTDIKLSVYNNVNPIHGFKLDFNANIKEDEKSKDFADLDGLNKGVKAKMTYVFFTPTPIQRATDIHRKQKNKLNNIYLDAKNDYDNRLKTIKANNILCNLDKVCKVLEKFKNAAKNAVNNYTYTPSSNSNAASWKPEQYLFSIGANREDFSVLNLSEFENESLDKTGIEIGLATQWLPTLFTRFKVGFDFQRSYEQGGDKVQYCMDVNDSDGLEKCIEGNTTSITKSYNRNISLKYGGYSSNDNSFIKGWDVNLTHNLSDSKTGVEIPLYFYSNKNNELNAGVKFGFIINGDEKDESETISIFFNTALDVF